MQPFCWIPHLSLPFIIPHSNTGTTYFVIATHQRMGQVFKIVWVILLNLVQKCNKCLLDRPKIDSFNVSI